MKFLLSGYYGHGNFGDELLLSSVSNRLREMFPNCEITIRDDSDLSHGPKPIRLVRWLWRQYRAVNVDWVIFGGGTVFHTRTNLLLQWAFCLLARLRGARIAALGVGTEARNLFILRRIVALCVCFCVRDEYSRHQSEGLPQQLAEFRPTRYPILTADLAFTMKFPKPTPGDRVLTIDQTGPLAMPDFNGVGKVVSSRLHPLILATIHGIPIEPIGNSPKIRGFYNSTVWYTLEQLTMLAEKNFDLLRLFVQASEQTG